MTCHLQVKLDLKICFSSDIHKGIGISLLSPLSNRTEARMTRELPSVAVSLSPAQASSGFLSGRRWPRAISYQHNASRRCLCEIFLGTVLNTNQINK